MQDEVAREEGGGIIDKSNLSSNTLSLAQGWNLGSVQVYDPNIWKHDSPTHLWGTREVLVRKLIKIHKQGVRKISNALNSNISKESGFYLAL